MTTISKLYLTAFFHAFLNGYDLEDNYDIKNLVSKILSHYNLPNNTIAVQPSSQVNNANAAMKDGVPYILFSKYFVETIRAKSNGDWRLAGIFAHEVAHHLLFHTTRNNQSRRDLELQADKWAGAALFRMGATLSQALACVAETNINGSNTHPPRSQREAAVRSGYEEEQRKGSPRPNPNPNDDNRRRPAKSDFTEYATGVSFTMKYVEGNSFQMGSEDGDSDEKPVHTVRLSDFYMSKYEVTFSEYDKFCEATGRKKPSDNGWGRGSRPVINVSWEDATAYCVWLSRSTGKTYRLPTEAEWEYAARGGQSYRYAGSDNLDAVAWHSGNGGSPPHPVGQKQANGLGLYDMSGNVWEWCSDWFGSYSSGAVSNPTGAVGGALRVNRGGSCSDNARNCRTTYRLNGTPTYRSYSLGFRVCSSL